MTFIKRLFGRTEKPAIEPMRGGVPARNPDVDHATDRGTRERMEAQVAADREKRAATDETKADSAT